jgi:hypothetical protein
MRNKWKVNNLSHTLPHYPIIIIHIFENEGTKFNERKDEENTKSASDKKKKYSISLLEIIQLVGKG